VYWFKSTFRLIEGTTDDVILELTFPAQSRSAVFVEGYVENVGANLVPTTLGSQFDAGSLLNSNKDLTFDFGQVINTADNVPDANDDIEVLFAVTLDDVDIHPGDEIFFEARLQYESDSISHNTSTTLKTIRPQLELRSIDVSPAVAQAGDTVTYTVVVGHEVPAISNSTAYLVEIVLTPETDLDLDDTSVVVTHDGLYSVTEGTTAGDTFIHLWVHELDLTDTDVTVTFDVLLTDDVESFQSYKLAAAITYHTWADFSDDSAIPTSFQQLGKEYSLTQADAVTDKTLIAYAATDYSIINSTLTVTDLDLTLGADVSIGEEVEFRAVVHIPEGISSLAVFDIIYPLVNGKPVLEYKSSNIRLGSVTSSLMVDDEVGDASDSLKLTWSLGDLLNAYDDDDNHEDVIMFDMQFLVIDDVDFIGESVTPTAAFNIRNQSSNTDFEYTADFTTLFVVAPDLSVTIVATPDASFDAQDVLNYVVTLSHGVQAYEGPAYDVNVTVRIDEEYFRSSHHQWIRWQW
jgi:hypothetical protein